MYKSILVPIDLNQDSSWKKTIPVAVQLAKASDAKIHVITVIPDFGMAVVGSFFPADFEKNATAATKKELGDFVKAHFPDELISSVNVAHGTIYKEIVAGAAANKCDLIVLASHRPETADYLLGPNAARVVRHADQSVFIVRD